MSHQLIGLPAAAPSGPALMVHQDIVNLLRQRRMTEDVISLWLRSPHKAFGMQVPDSMIAEGRGDEILRLLDDAYHLRPTPEAKRN